MASNAGYPDTISGRAAAFININHPGANRIKRIAKALKVSPSWAKVLAAGRGWTADRLDQATLQWPAFKAFVWPQAADFDDRLDQVLKEIAAVREEISNLKTTLGRE